MIILILQLQARLRTHCAAVLVLQSHCRGQGFDFPTGRQTAGSIGQIPYYAANGTALTATSSLFIATSGNVGIGTTTPYSKLTVWGASGQTDLFRVVSTASTTVFGASVSPSGSIFTYGQVSTSTVPNNQPYAWTIATSTTAQPLLRIDSTAGSEGIAFGVSGSDVLIGEVGAPSNLIFEENSTIKGQDSGRTLTFGANSDIINVAVNLGVGSTSPWRTLSVSGTVGFDGLTGATGAGSLCLSSNKEVLYNSGSDNCLSSTRATKHDIDALAIDALSQVLALEPVSFVYKEGDGRTRYGFIAEDTAAVNASLATYDASRTISGIDDRAILSLVVKALKEVASKLSETAHLMIDRLTARRGEFQELCVGSVCVTEAQFMATFGAAASAPPPTFVPSSPSNMSELPGTTTPSDLTLSEQSDNANATSTAAEIEPDPNPPETEPAGAPVQTTDVLPSEPANDNLPPEEAVPASTSL